MVARAVARVTVPVVQDDDELAGLEGELVVLGSLEVVQGADLTGVLPSPAVVVVGRVSWDGQGACLHLLLVLQGQLDGCGGLEESGHMTRVLVLQESGHMTGVSGPTGTA